MSDLSVKSETKNEQNPGKARSELPRLHSSVWGMNPFGLMRQLVEDLDKTFGPGSSAGTGATWAPAVEVKEANGSYCVTAELPGLHAENVKVTATANHLHLEGERKEEKEEKKEGYYRSERSYGKFYRSLALPAGANVDEAKASFQNGLLEISIPLGAKTESKKEIPIQSGTAAKAAAG